MARFRIGFLYVLFLIAVPAFVHAQDASPANTELAALQAKVDVVTDYHEAFFALVEWAIGGFLVLIGFGWFAQWRIHDRDLDRIRAELLAQVRSDAATAHENIHTTLHDTVEKLRADMRAMVQDELDTHTDATKQRFNVLEQTVHKMLAKLMHEVLKNADPKNPSTWFDAMEASKSAILSNDAFVISQSLDTLARIVKVRESVGTFELERMVALTRLLPDRYAESGQQILEIARERIKEPGTTKSK